MGSLVPGRRRGWVAKVMTALLSTLVCGVAVEIGLRGWYGHPAPFLYPQVRHVSTEYGYKLEASQRGTHTVSQPVVSNAHGFRDREWPAVKAPGVARVMVLGDSLTFGNGVRAEDRFTDVLQTSMENSRTRVDIMNVAVGGWNLANEIAFFEMEGLDLQPDVLVLAFFPNDWASPRSPAARVELTDGGRYDSRPLWLRWLPYRVIFWLKRPAVVRYLRDRIGVVTQGPDFVSELLQDRVDLDGSETVRYTLSELARLKRLCDAHGVRMVLASIPPINLFWVPRGSARYVDHLGRFAEREKIAFIDLAERFWSVDNTNDLYMYPWDNHLSPAGHRLIAEQLEPVVEHETAVLSRPRDES